MARVLVGLVLLVAGTATNVRAIEEDMGGETNLTGESGSNGETVGGTAPEVEAVTSPAPPSTDDADLTVGSPAAQLTGTWRALAMCESTLNPRAVSPNGLYFGLYQFDLLTWRSVGEVGNPINHSPAVQLAAAQRLQARRGWAPWPNCGRRLGLLR